MKLGNNFTCVCSKFKSFPLPKGSGNYQNFDKTRVKLLPNFTRHHFITHTNNLDDSMNRSRDVETACVCELQLEMVIPKRQFLDFKPGREKRGLTELTIHFPSTLHNVFVLV